MSTINLDQLASVLADRYNTLSGKFNRSYRYENDIHLILNLLLFFFFGLFDLI